MTLTIASICTVSRLSEFLITKFSLEQYHQCRWVVATDRAAYQYLSTHFPNDHWFPVVQAEGSHIKGEYEPFFQVVLNKMTMLRRSIEEFGPSIMLDSDLLFVGGFDEQLLHRYAVVASDHHIPTDRTQRVFGRYNVGMIGCRDTAFVDRWMEITLRDRSNLGLEQKPFQLALAEMRIPFGVFPEGCNVGWWRDTEDPFFFDSLSVQHDNLFVGCHPVTNFHFHIDARISRGYEEKFRNYFLRALSKSTNPKHHELLTFINATFESDMKGAYANL